MRVSKTRIVLCTIAVTVAAFACDEPAAPPEPPPDLAPPALTVLSPVGDEYDLDGDGLLDLRVEWSDSAGEVDPSSAVVRVLDGIRHPGEDAVDLLERWTVERLDEQALIIHETIEHLLYSGRVTRRIEVMVSDSAGNLLADTVEFTLPPLSLHKKLRLEAMELIANRAKFCEDDGRLYISMANQISRIEPIELVEEQRTSFVPGITVGDLACLPDDRIAAGTNYGLMVFERQTSDMVFEKLWPALGLARSKQNPDLVYGGAGNSPVSEVYAFHRADGEIMDTIPVPPQPGYGRDWLVALEVLPGDEKLYVAKWDGVYAVNPLTHEFLGRVRITEPRDGNLGNSEDLLLSEDASWLYVPVTYGMPHGLALVPTDQDSAVHIIEFFDAGWPIRVAVSPSGSRAFVTTVDSDDDGVAHNYLVRPVPHGAILARLPHNAPAVEDRFDGAVAFHPNGRYLFLGYTLRASQETYLESYLNRERRMP